MTHPDELERAVAAAEEWISMAETCEIVGPSGVLRYPPICNSEFEALRLILSANREMREALGKISAGGPSIGPVSKNTYRHGFDQGCAWAGGVARSALTTQRGK